MVVAKGYGVRSLATKEPVDANTLFGIASNTKAFTTAALGLLVDEGKLRWDDKVTDYIPEFRMYDPYVTAEFTVRDLLTHRSGLGLGAGDLMFFPDSSDWKQVAVAQKAAPKKPDYSACPGRYHDAWPGDVNLYMQGNQLWLRAVRAPRLVGQVLPYRGNTFAVRWKARSFNADAFASFALDEMGRATGIKMRPFRRPLISATTSKTWPCSGQSEQLIGLMPRIGRRDGWRWAGKLAALAIFAGRLAASSHFSR